MDTLPELNTNEQQETTTFESVSYVIDDDDEGSQSIQIQETSTTTVTGNNGSNFLLADQSDKSAAVEGDQNKHQHQEGSSVSNL